MADRFFARNGFILQRVVAVSADTAKMYDGNFYFIKGWQDVDGAATEVLMMFRTPDTSTRIHAKVALAAEDEFTVEIFKDATIGVAGDGTPIVPQNCDQDSTNTPELAPFSGPTVTDDGTLIWSTKLGSARTAAVGLQANYEIIAKTNSVYLFKITKINPAIHWVDYDFFWYEGN